MKQLKNEFPINNLVDQTLTGKATTWMNMNDSLVVPRTIEQPNLKLKLLTVVKMFHGTHF